MFVSSVSVCEGKHVRLNDFVGGGRKRTPELVQPGFKGAETISALFSLNAL